MTHSGNPWVLIFDEPRSGLEVSPALVLKNLYEHGSGRGKSGFYVAHVLEVVEQVCPLLILRQGAVLLAGRPGYSEKTNRPSSWSAPSITW